MSVKVFQGFSGSAMRAIAGAQKYFAGAGVALKGYWTSRGPTDHSRTTIDGDGFYTYQVTMHPGTVDDIAKTGICTIDILVTPISGTAGAQWGVAPDSPPTRQVTAPGGGSLTFDAVNCPADSLCRIVLISNAGGQLDQWAFH